MLINNTGRLRKMSANLESAVSYQLCFDNGTFPLNEHIGKGIKISFSGTIRCVNCERVIKKSFQQGHCFPCTQKLASCDSCIIKPELCHFHLNTCREPEWAMNHCMQPHIVYLANASDIKVGITRKTQIPTRWIDQGAIQALPIFEVSNRRESGLIEVVFKAHVKDKTNWRKMLKGEAVEQDLESARESLMNSVATELSNLKADMPDLKMLPLEAEVVAIQYPVLQHPSKIVSLNLDKQPEYEGTLCGIKGQYLIMDNAVINIRKYSGYEVTCSIGF